MMSKKANALKVGDVIVQDIEYVSYSWVVCEIKHKLGMVFVGTVDGEGFDGGWHRPDVRFQVVPACKGVAV